MPCRATQVCLVLGIIPLTGTEISLAATLMTTSPLVVADWIDQDQRFSADEAAARRHASQQGGRSGAVGAVTTTQDAAGGCDGIKNGRFGFQTTDLALPARVPLAVGRTYDLGVAAYDPTPPSVRRSAHDLGPNWVLRPSSILFTIYTGFMLFSDDAGLTSYVPAGGGAFRA